MVNDDNRNDGLTFTSVTTVSKIPALCNDIVFLIFYSSGHKQEQPVGGLLVCVDLVLVSKTTHWLITQFINNTMRQAVIYI